MDTQAMEAFTETEAAPLFVTERDSDTVKAAMPAHLFAVKVALVILAAGTAAGAVVNVRTRRLHRPQLARNAVRTGGLEADQSHSPVEPRRGRHISELKYDTPLEEMLARGGGPSRKLMQLDASDIPNAFTWSDVERSDGSRVSLLTESMNQHIPQ